MKDLHAWAADELDRIRDSGRLRDTVATRAISAVEVLNDGRKMILFSSNDYLGLSWDPQVRRAAADCALERGMGARGSALICGYSDLHAALEAELSSLKQSEAALLFPTGYAANLSTLEVFGDGDAVIFSDALNHASIIDGCRRARGRVEVYRHADVDHLESLLRKCDAPRRIIVTDSVFSMEGDCAPLAELVELRDRYRCVLVLDEAHATGVLGPGGGGLAEALGLAGEIDLQIGTLSKALAAQGGYVACSEQMRRLLLNRARPFVFSTALPLPVVAAARAALERARDGKLRQQLFDRVEQVGHKLGRALTTPIVPIVLGEEEHAVRASRELARSGFQVTPIRPPTVPPGTSRLRVTLSAAHTSEQVDELLDALREIGADSLEKSKAG